ncbi:MAG: hypothetical protein BWY15_00820 [Firmicutes bacterium ADurb.Bin193]|nr:MAG: hypothetical protein BWY15_00820 [Firmicutes bacterium ADurb.Bin193]
MTYFKLLDPKHKNTIVRAEGSSQQKFCKGKGWVDSGIMMQYFAPYDDNDLYNMYEEITEQEAMDLIN